MDYDVKQVIVLRKDLNMRKGKACAQAAHASMKVLLDRMKFYGFEDSDWPQPKGCNVDGFTDKMMEWIRHSFAKIVVSCNSEEELFELQKKAKSANIVNAIILDNGSTEFKTNHCIVCDSENLQEFKNRCLATVGRCKCGDCGAEMDNVNVIVKNKPTYTALAIGPDDSSKIDLITKDLKLL